MSSRGANKYTEYERLVRRLYRTNLFNAVKLGLDNTERLHRALGDPMDDPSLTVIHVAGTNGKGSVCHKLSRTLSKSGHTTGLFVSPHISSFRERCQVDGQCMSEEDVIRLLPTIYSACETEDIPATFFEITTALAFLYFREAGCDAVVLETGLGGRLDATNVIKSPAISIITSIGLEHTRILGDTVEEIALEKAGIIKKGRPVLMGPCVPHDVVRNYAKKVDSGNVYTVGDVLGSSPRNNLQTENNASPPSALNVLPKDLLTAVDFDKENSQIAEAALRILTEEDSMNRGDNSRLKTITDHDIEQGVSTRPACRFETVTIRCPKTEKNVTVILDVAHNPPALAQLLTKLESTFPGTKRRIVIGMSSDKDIGLSADIILSVVPPGNIHLVQAAHPRAATIDQIRSCAPALASTVSAGVDCSIDAQVRGALELSAWNDEILVVCGSVFIMSEARMALGFEEPRDTDCISEVAGANLRHSQEHFGNDTITTDSEDEAEEEIPPGGHRGVVVSNA